MRSSWWAALLLCSICTLTWNANTEPDLAGYRIYHSLVSKVYGGAIDTLALDTNVTCEELGITQDGLLHFWSITAFDAAGQESLFSQEVSMQMLTARVCLHRNRHGRCTLWG